MINILFEQQPAGRTYIGSLDTHPLCSDAGYKYNIDKTTIKLVTQARRYWDEHSSKQRHVKRVSTVGIDRPELCSGVW